MADSEVLTETYRAPAFADFNPEHSSPGATPERDELEKQAAKV